jgi:hypothetical protein
MEGRGRVAVAVAMADVIGKRSNRESTDRLEVGCERARSSLRHSVSSPISSIMPPAADRKSWGGGEQSNNPDRSIMSTGPKKLLSSASDRRR